MTLPSPSLLRLPLVATLGAFALIGCAQDSADSTNEGAESDAGPGGAGGAGGEVAGGHDGHHAGAGGEAPGGAEADASVPGDALPVGGTVPDAAPPSPACDEEDAHAGNFDLAHAKAVEPGFSADDLYLCAESEDWYALTLEAGAYVVVQIAAEPAENDLDLFLHGADGAVITQSASEGGVEELAYTADAAGTYYVRVVGGFRDVASAYALAVTSACRLDSDCGADEACSLFTGQCEPAPDNACGRDDQEQNDRDAAGFAIDVAGGPVAGVICGADPDWYNVTAQDGDDLEVLLSFPGGEDLDLVVRDLTRGGVVGFSAGDANSNPERVRLSHLAAGDYAVGVLFYEMDLGGTREVDYRLDVAIRAGGCVTDADCTGLNGPVCDAARGVCGPVPEAGRVPVGGQCGTAEDCGDQGAFCHPAGPGGGDNYCTVECQGDADCAALGDGAYCGRSMGGSICSRPCQDDSQCSVTRECNDGRCERREQCQSNDDCAEDEVCAQTPFGALICQARPPAAECGYDTLPDGTVRPDDDREHAAALPADGMALDGQHICDGDLDWYRVTVPAENAADLLRVSVAFRDGVDLDVYVQDAAGNTVGAATSADQTEEIVALRWAAAGDYFVIVDQFGSDALSDTEYTVTALIEVNEDRCTEEGRECIGTDPLRMACSAETGACGPFDGHGEVALGGLCDSDDDCAEGTEACWIYEGAAGAQRGANICTHTCQGDGDCADVPGTGCTDFQGQVAVCLPE